MADARDTKMQENGSLVFFEHLIEKGKEPKITNDIFDKVL